MDCDQVLATLRTHEAEMKRRGVTHAGVFGSVARGEARADSDIDILLDISPDIPMGLVEFIALTHYVSDLFPIKVDVVEKRSLKRFVQPSVERDAVYAF